MIVTALIACYNEADILRAMLRHWIQRGMFAYVLDNWSDDGSYEIALSEPGVAVERWPSHPIDTFEWGAMLDHFQQRLREIPSDWFSLSGADHYLAAPDGGDDVLAAIAEADRLGYNALEMIHRNFTPPDDTFVSGDPVATFNRHYYDSPGFLCDTWKKLPGITPDLRGQGGHDVRFPGRRVFPRKFIRQHYPIRSQAHGERKVFRERRPRWSDAERAIGWHVQYDDVEPGHVWVIQS
jgi:hypothetical protein